MNRRGHLMAIIILACTVIGLLIALITLYLQVHPATDDCQVFSTPTHRVETNSPVCQGSSPDFASAAATRCKDQGYDGYDSRAASCTNGTLTFDCLTVTKVCT